MSSLKIFINYRRADHAEFVELIWTHFMLRWGQDNVFIDFETIPPFEHFEAFIREEVRKRDVIVPIIGPRWLEIVQQKEREGKPDFVRIEIQEGLAYDKIFAPIVIQGASVPDASKVPSDVRPVWQCNMMELQSGRGFRQSVQTVMDGIEDLVKRRGLRRIPIVVSPTAPQPSTDDTQPFNLSVAIEHLLQARKEKAWLNALEWLETIKAANVKVPPYLGLDEKEQEIHVQIRTAQEQRRRREAVEYLYQIAVVMDRYQEPKKSVGAALLEVWRLDKQHDPAQLFPRYVGSTDILPQPFAWIKVPKGKVTLIEDYWEDQGYLRKGQQQTFDVEAFEIGKYPVTVAQYALFVEANGYGTQTYWTPAGWQWRTNNSITLPRLWEEPRWHQPDHPIVGVSWYEAMAYCQWLSALTGEAIHLPTEQQWQRAGQGDDGRLFPWGNKFDPSFCNNSVAKSNSSGTTAVTQYEQVKSPYGTKDQSGNVWEWCLTDFDSGKREIENVNRCVVRGGSWYNDHTDYFRVVYRDRLDVDYRYDLLGFRLARSLNQF